MNPSIEKIVFAAFNSGVHLSLTVEGRPTARYTAKRMCMKDGFTVEQVSRDPIEAIDGVISGCPEPVICLWEALKARDQIANEQELDEDQLLQPEELSIELVQLARAQGLPSVALGALVREAGKKLLSQLGPLDAKPWPSDVAAEAKKIAAAHTVKGVISIADDWLASWAFSGPNVPGSKTLAGLHDRAAAQLLEVLRAAQGEQR